MRQEIDRLRTSEIFRDRACALIAVEAVQSWHRRTGSGCQSYASIKPVAVVVCSRGGAYAFDMEAKCADLDRLRQDIPELDAVIASFGGVQI